MHHSSSMPHPFVSYLSVTKGKRVLPRAVQFLSPDQVLTLVGTLLVRAESVDVFSVQLGTTSEAVSPSPLSETTRVRNTYHLSTGFYLHE